MPQDRPSRSPSTGPGNFTTKWRGSAISHIMINLRSGLAALVEWERTNRSLSKLGTRVDRRAIRGSLGLPYPDIEMLANTIQHDGVVAIPGYWSVERCAEARSTVDRLIETYPDCVQHYSNGSDERMFGVESASELLMTFHADPFLRQFGEMAGGLSLYNFATLAGRITAKDGNAGSGAGWHRDANGYQFKAIIYLSDTALDNGPFEYLIGSHKTWRAAIDTMIGEIPGAPNTRFEHEQIERLVRRLKIERRVFTAKAGTLLLAATSGIHRGMPLTAGNRYALTNYYYSPSQIGESQITKFQPLIPGTAERIRRDLF